MQAIFLVDNGSLRPEATLNLRRVAALLSERSGYSVQAASLLHSNKVPAEDLDGEPAVTLGPAVEKAAQAGVDEVIVLPFFFGPSLALTDYLPERMAAAQGRFPGLRVRVAMPLVDELGKVDTRLAQWLADNVREQLTPETRPSVVLVDHGSPIPEVAAIRQRLTGQLSMLLADEVGCVTSASMERREGDAYRFNDPLLETLLANPALPEGEVILAMLFLSPGRHAGEGGDIAAINAAAMSERPGLNIVPTRLVGEHVGIVDLLQSRLQAALLGECLVEC
ncbi:cobalamin biosynthesis protein CbiX [Halomonas sp. BLK-85]